ncbi:hypothetical protein P3T76_011480 [Phytophthora citrophthora]|uniref:Uncharacterized protein n=1 Tax=Phytophthora citrophthora TaxID=4793 RepID=A0AAD9G9H7_9STRA|nr:hypothetical protein P3T76_011480 [Phytophthora citrophthora]
MKRRTSRILPSLCDFQMEALDRARAVNTRLALPRLERMLRVYRTWVNVEGVEGGMALTRRELQCVLEFPEFDHHVDFLFDVFRCVSANGKSVPKVDLMTLLTTAAILAQGALEDKARFVFQLVDLDTEDDIVEAELALVISTCCNGLDKLGLIEEGDNVSELDAMAVAYEAFDFVELEDGDKMTFTMFLKWCVFHPRPKEVLGRMSCLFSICDCVRGIQDALEERSKRLLNSDTLVYYNDMHFGSLDESAERVHVVAGPIVGKVESTRVNLILEVDTLATVKCFAFALPQEGTTMEMGFSVVTKECELRAFNPVVFSVIGLSPGTMYVLRFLGVCKADRERCVAVVTTKSRESTLESNSDPLSVLSWRVRVLNHHLPAGERYEFLRTSEADAYQKIARDGYQSTQPTLTVHFGIFLSPVQVSAMLKILGGKNTQRRDEDIDEQVLYMLRQEYRRVLGEPIIWTLLRTHSNWIMDDSVSVLFGGFLEWRNAKRTTWSVAETNLMRVALPVWQSYIECLWGHTQNNVRCLELGGGIIFAPINGRFDLQSENYEVAFTKQISDLMRKFPSPSAIWLGTEPPIFGRFCDMNNDDAPNNANAGYAQCLRLVQELVTWNLADQKRQVLLLSFDDAGGYRSLISFKNTTVTIQQFVCGPVIGIHSARTGNLRSQTHQTDQLILHHGVLDERPQYAQISSLRDLRDELKAVVGERKASEGTDAPYTVFQAQLLPLQPQHEIHRVLGPVVGCVSSRIARVLLVGDADGEVTCVAVDRLTLEEHRVVKRIESHQPTIFYITKLTPGRTYDLSFQGLLNDEPGKFQTPHEHLPAFRLVIVADDRFLDGRTDECTSFDGAATESAISYIGNVANYVFPGDGAFQADITVHMGSVVALAHDLQQTYHLLAQGQQKLGESQLSNTVRECVRHHWNTPKTRQLLAHGAHWFPSIGVLRALLTANDVPISFIRAVQNILAEYEQVGDLRSHSVSPSHRYLYQLQDTVAVLMIDTLEVILGNEQLTSFAQLPETLLSAAQWSGLEFWLANDRPKVSQGHQIDNTNTVVIMCDTPLILHQGKSAELTHMWHQNSRAKPDSVGVCASMADIGALSWDSYPKEQARLLHLIFRKLQKVLVRCILIISVACTTLTSKRAQNSRFHVVFVCCGAFASRDTITEKSTKLSFQHVTVGPISRSGVSHRDPSSNDELTFGDKELCSHYSIRREIPLGALNSQQYCALELVPHPFRASNDVRFYTQHHGEARLVVGPIIGRVTPRTARILIEIDRPVSNLSCTLIDPATLQRYSTQMKVEAFTPTILKVEGLQPGTRYAIKFEGLMDNNNAAQGHVVTPAWVSLALDWIVVNCNSMANFLDHQPTDSQSTGKRYPPSSQWPRILAKGMPSFTAQLAAESSYRNGDFLGDHDDEGEPNFNPWHSIEDEFLSEPLACPQLLLHLGGQVDMSRAFTNEELGSLVVRLTTLMESSGFNEDNEGFQLLRLELRYRFQEVYRVAWGVPPMRKLLGYCSNLMLLNEDTDLYFNRRNLRSILSKCENERVPESILDKVVLVLRGIAFELWQLYQNQLWTDVAERELQYGSKSSGNKNAFSTTFGINRIVVANVSHEAYEYSKTVEGDMQQNASSSGAVKRYLEEPSTAPAVSLYSASSWKIIDEACEASSAVEHKTAQTKPQNPVQQLVLVTSGDLMAWGGSKHYPGLRSEIVKLLEKLFAWKFANRVQREVALICVRTTGSSITFEITDEKISEKLTLTCVGSISDARELLHRDQKKAKGGVPAMTKGAVIAKGNFSKRFSYRAITNTTNVISATNSSVPGREKQVAEDNDSASRTTTRCRTFVSYRFITDYRRGLFNETLRFFPPRVALPKAVLGPVVGRMVLKEAPRQDPEEVLVEGDPGDPVKMIFTVPILLEINADARVVCVVTDILANQDIRVMDVLTCHHPHVFEIPSLIPERRYIYRFEGIANSEDRGGSFHTPSSSSSPLTFVAVSSNFPEQMEESADSLWAALSQRVQVSWCGLDLILHLGGQVPMHEAAFECFEWIRREWRLHDQSEDNHNEAYIASLRRKVRQRLQQRYRLCWNVPNVRETLAHTSNWFLRSQADVAPFFRNHEMLATKAAQIVLGEAKQVVADYQLSLMLHDATASEEIAPEDVNGQAKENPAQHEGNQNSSGSDENIPEQVTVDTTPEIGNQIQNESESPPENIAERSDTAQFIQTGEIGIFMCDMRDTPRGDFITCNNRLLTPLTQQEHAVIGEKQWQELEKALKKKATMVFVLCMELPLVLTDAMQVDALREEATVSGVDSTQEEIEGRWRLYDRQTVSQHWVSCRRQLEQLLNLLFRWKAKHRGRDVIVLSGGMRVGLETLLQDRDTTLSIRSLTVGPLTARVEPDFENLPLDGIACPTFLGGPRDDRFTFAHSIVSSKNYLLAQASVTREQTEKIEERGKAAGENKSASIKTEFIADDGGVDAAHPITQYKRFPSWWSKYVPMGKIVFWDDTVTMRTQSDEDMSTLAGYLQDGRDFTAALEVLFEKHQFAEAARMEELRSKHRRRQRGPDELKLSLRAVFSELWKVLPEQLRQRLVYFQDEFVFDFLLGYLAPDLFVDDQALDEDVERPPLEFAAFSTLCRDFIFNAGVLNLCLNMQQGDEHRTIERQRAEARRQAAERETQRIQHEQQRAEEEAELTRLQQENPEEYSKRKLAEQEIAQKEKLAKAEAARELRKAEKMRDVEEELAIAKEQRKLDKLAESGNDPVEFNRRREMVAARIRKFEERKRHQEADEARRREKKEKKKKEKALS